MSTVKRITEEVLTLSAASSAAFAVSGPADTLLNLCWPIMQHLADRPPHLCSFAGHAQAQRANQVKDGDNLV